MKILPSSIVMRPNFCRVSMVLATIDEEQWKYSENLSASMSDAGMERTQPSGSFRARPTMR